MTAGSLQRILEDALRQIKKVDADERASDAQGKDAFCLTEYFTEKELSKMPKLKDGRMRFHGGVWEIRYRRDGYDKTFSAKNQKDAVIKFRKFIQTIKHTAPPKRARKTFAAYAAYALELKRPLLKEESFTSYEKILKNYLVPAFGDKSVVSVKPADLQMVVNELYAEGKTRTILDVKTVASFIFGTAYRNEVVTRNVADFVEWPKHHRVNGCALTRSEEAELLRMIKGSYYELPIRFMLYSGCRRAELAMIYCDGVDEDANVIRIRCAKGKGILGDVVRELPLFPMLKVVVRALGPRRSAAGGLLFAGLSLSELTKFFHRLLPEHHLYELRHTFVSRAKECGVNPELVATWAGHDFEGLVCTGRRRGVITRQVYTHYSMEYQQSEASKIVYCLDN